MVVVSAEDDLLFVWVEAHACNLAVHHIGIQEKHAFIVASFILGRHYNVVFVCLSSLVRDAYRVIFHVDADLT